MESRGARQVEVSLTPALHRLPKRLDQPGWQHSQDYTRDRNSFPAIDLNGREFVYDGL